MPQSMGLKESDTNERQNLCPGLVGCKEQKLLQAVSTMECIAVGIWASMEPTAGPTESSDSRGHCLSPGLHDLYPMALQLYLFASTRIWFPSLKEAQGQGWPQSYLEDDRDFLGGPVAETLCSQCRAPGFHPWSGN